MKKCDSSAASLKPISCWAFVLIWSFVARTNCSTSSSIPRLLHYCKQLNFHVEIWLKTVHLGVPEIACCTFWQDNFIYRCDRCQTPPAFDFAFVLMVCFSSYISQIKMKRTTVRCSYFRISTCVCVCVWFLCQDSFSDVRFSKAIFDEWFGTDSVAHVMRTHNEWYLKCDRWFIQMFCNSMKNHSKFTIFRPDNLWLGLSPLKSAPNIWWDLFCLFVLIHIHMHWMVIN